MQWFSDFLDLVKIWYAFYDKPKGFRDTVQNHRA